MRRRDCGLKSHVGDLEPFQKLVKVGTIADDARSLRAYGHGFVPSDTRPSQNIANPRKWHDLIKLDRDSIREAKSLGLVSWKRPVRA